MDRALLQDAVERAPVNDDGRSGATLERVRLRDGSRVIVKRFDPSVDLVMQLSGDTRGREVALFESGILDRLPESVLHPVVDAWYGEDGLGVLVMRDLGDAVLSWKSVVRPEQARTMLRACADLHAAFLGEAPAGLTPLDAVLSMFEPDRIRPHAGARLIDFALRGWEYWPEVAPGEVGDRVLALAKDTGPITAACLALQLQEVVESGRARRAVGRRTERAEQVRAADDEPADVDLGRADRGQTPVDQGQSTGPVGLEGHVHGGQVAVQQGGRQRVARRG